MNDAAVWMMTHPAGRVFFEVELGEDLESSA